MITKEDIQKKEKLLADIKLNFDETNRILAEKALLFERVDFRSTEAAYQAGEMTEKEWNEFRNDYEALSAWVRYYDDKNRRIEEERLQKNLEETISAMKKEYRKQKIRAIFKK